MKKVKLSELLNSFRKEDTLFKTPEKLLLCKEENQKKFSISYNLTSKWKDEVRALQKQHHGQLIIGAIPFDNRTKATIIVPEQLMCYQNSDIIDDLQIKNQSSKIAYGTDIPERHQFNEMIQQAINYINDQQFNKVVLARTLTLRLETEPQVSAWLTNLIQKNNQGYIFSIGTDFYRSLIGASPELLVKKEGKMVTINPLAGSRKLTWNKEKDAELEKELLHSKKDLHEHKIVVDFMCERLSAYLSNIDFNENPDVLYTDTMIHLSTVIKGEVKNDSISSLDLAELLHPTPAICGEPQKQSLDFIQKIEPFSRGYYTGLVGYMDGNGDGEWVITIRCAEIKDKEITLFAGAGIVNNSIQNSEYNEISGKFTTILNAMGLNELF